MVKQVLMLGLLAVLAFGCQSAESVTCDNGTVCAAGLVCTAANSCALPEQVSACAGKSDEEQCSLSLGAGFCEDGACQVPQCGNGRLDTGEACDDGNGIDNDACSNDCAEATCGDGIVQGNDECDDGEANADDRACTSVCRLARCGDGLLRVDLEECDTGLGNADDSACTLACEANACGDGRVWAGVEACDDGNTASGDGCRDDCRKAEVCGDALLDSGEGCDDGNVNAVDGCDACQPTQWSTSAVLGGSASAVELNYPTGVAVDNLGNVYIADRSNHRIRRVDASTGVITTVAGTGISGYSGDNGLATSAQLRLPGGVAVDGLGHIYISDSRNQRIRRVDASTGVITTVAGNGSLGYSGDTGPATSAQLEVPFGIVVAGLGHIYFADRNNGCIRRVDAETGVITTVAGTGSPGYSGDNGPATSARLDFPKDVALDDLGNLYIADSSNHRIRRVDASTGVITTVAGTGSPGYSGDNGLATSAELSSPSGVAVDGLGHLYIAGSRVRRVDASTGVITTVPSALLASPEGVVVDGLGNIYIAERTGHRILRVDAATGITTTVAGSAGLASAGDNGFATSAQLQYPAGVTVDGQGHIYIADSFDYRIRRVDADTGVITTVAGNGTRGYSGDNGPATDAELQDPHGVAVDGQGNIYIADRSNQRIRRVDAATGVITTVAGDGTFGDSGDNGPATDAQLAEPHSVVVDGQGHIYIGDSFNSRIRRVDADTGVITTVAGNGIYGYSGDNGAATDAQLAEPIGLAVDGQGHLFIADLVNNRIRRVDADTGVITTVAGNGGWDFSGDNGPATDAELKEPNGIAVDGQGHLYIGDSFNSRIRRVDADTGVITTLAGDGTFGDAGDNGPASSAQLSTPFSVAVDGLGHVYIADVDSQRIRRVDADTDVITTVAGAIFLPGMGLAPEAHLVSAEAMVLAESVTFFAGGSSGTVQQFAHGEAKLESVIGRIEALPVATASFARYRASDFGGVGGVAYNAADRLVYLTETSSNRIHAVSIDDAGNGVLPTDPDTWTIATLAGDAGTTGYADGIALSAEFREPQGLYFDEASRQLYVADTGNHVIRVIDVDVGTISTVVGTASTLGYFGDGGDAADALLFQPSTMTLCPNGDLFIADTGSNHIRRVEAGTNVISTVIGVGIAASSGQGSPASAFPVDDPRGLACDDFGNLFVTSRATIRLLPADDSGVVDGTGSVQTIYGAPPRDTFPASVTTCLTGIVVTNGNNGATMLQAADSCSGTLVELTRTLEL